MLYALRCRMSLHFLLWRRGSEPHSPVFCSTLLCLQEWHQTGGPTTTQSVYASLAHTLCVVVLSAQSRIGNTYIRIAASCLTAQNA